MADIKEDGTPANATGAAVAGTGGGVHWSKKQPRMGVSGKLKKYGQPILFKTLRRKAVTEARKTVVDYQHELDRKKDAGENVNEISKHKADVYIDKANKSIARFRTHDDPPKDFSTTQDRHDDIRKRIAKNQSREKYRSLAVQKFYGHRGAKVKATNESKSVYYKVLKKRLPAASRTSAMGDGSDGSE